MTMMEKLRHVLSDGQWHSTAELVARVGHRFSAMLYRAKQTGWKVERRRVDFRTFEYWLVMRG